MRPSINNGIQNIFLTGDSLSIDDEPVDLSHYLDNTDEQDLYISGDSLMIDNGDGIDISNLI